MAIDSSSCPETVGDFGKFAGLDGPNWAELAAKPGPIIGKLGSSCR
jgi:hypothetical protein